MTEQLALPPDGETAPRTPAVDKHPTDRPGVPHETAPQPLANAHWLAPDQQTSVDVPLVGHGRRLTSVYSIANPPRGLSGLVRRLAYRIPDYRPRRWMMLMLADRIDVLESNPGKLLRAAGAVGLVGLGVYGFFKLRPKQS